MQNMRSKLGVSAIFVGEADAVLVDEDTAIVGNALIRGAIAHAVESVSLISTHVSYSSPQFHTPLNTLSGGTGSVIRLSHGHFRHVLCYHFLIGGKARST